MEQEKIVISYKCNTKIILIVSIIIMLAIGIFNYLNNSYGSNNLIWIIYSIFGIVLLTFYFYCKNTKLVVTNTNVYCRVGFGKRIDLPLDAISATGTSSFGGIDIRTSSGIIHFKFVKNNEEIHKEISKLLSNRQTEKKEQSIVNNSSSADEIKKYKELLDSGAITQDEFEAKKKQLLEL